MQRSDHNYLVKENCVVNEKYPAQMVEVPGDLRQAPAKFENPEVGISRQRLCNHAFHLNNIELQEQIIKQQFGEELLPQRRQLKYKARSKVLLPILEVFGKVFKQSLSFCYVFSIRTKTKKKQKNKIIGIQMLSWS